MGGEHRGLEFCDRAAPAIGGTIRFLTSHCNPTVNLYSAFHVVRGNEGIGLWAIHTWHSGGSNL